MFLEPRELPSEAAQRWTPRFTRWDAALVVCLALVVLSAGISLWQAAMGTTPVQPVSSFSAALTFVLTGGIPLLWLLRTRQRPITGSLDYLRLRNATRAFPRGLGVGLLMAMTAAAALQTLPGPVPPLPILLRQATFYCAAAPFAEEVLFRGILQPRFGIVAQAALFATLHLTGLGLHQAVLVLAFGLTLGYTSRRWGLWASIAAHATYNLVALL